MLCPQPNSRIPAGGRFQNRSLKRVSVVVVSESERRLRVVVSPEGSGSESVSMSSIKERTSPKAQRRVLGLARKTTEISRQRISRVERRTFAFLRFIGEASFGSMIVSLYKSAK